MRKLVVTEKTGYKVNDIYKPIVIRDYRGIMFYTTEPLLPKVKEFNLPTGTYFVDSGYFSPMPYPVEYELKKLPPPQRKFPKPYDYRVRFDYNPNKCTIFWDLGIILFDNRLKDCSLPELYFILYHEISHARYKEEKYADLMAVNYMLCKGFNPSQIGMAPITSLSSAQYERKKYIVEKL